jgi:hypothetical protein
MMNQDRWFQNPSLYLDPPPHHFGSKNGHVWPLSMLKNSRTDNRTNGSKFKKFRAEK